VNASSLKPESMFPREVEDDPWIIFHGTSSFSEQDIERDGFVPKPPLVSSDDVRALQAIYESMRWDGRWKGGQEVLSSFGNDYTDSATPVYFSDASVGALVYATRDFTGGERCRAARNAIHDLDLLLIDGDMRAAHYDEIYQEHLFLVKHGWDPSAPEALRPQHVDLSWLRSGLEALSDLRKRVQHPISVHTHGILYALRMDPSDIPHLHHVRGGISASAKVCISKVVARMRVPPDFTSEEAPASIHRTERLLRNGGLFRALNEKVTS
jgi:hypothetical protein